MSLTRAGAEDFLYREARYIDEHRYAEWLELWAPEGDIVYWVPAGRDDIDPAREVSIIYDDRGLLAQRLARLDSPAAHSQDPRSRLRHLVTNVEVAAAGEDTARVEANFSVIEFRRGRQTVYGGRTIHELERGSGEWRIRSKKVLLVNNDDYLGNFTFLI